MTTLVYLYLCKIGLYVVLPITRFLVLIPGFWVHVFHIFTFIACPRETVLKVVFAFLKIFSKAE